MYKESEKENLQKKISGERDIQIMEEREEIRVSKLESSCSETEVSGMDRMGECQPT